MRGAPSEKVVYLYGSALAKKMSSNFRIRVETSLSSSWTRSAPRRVRSKCIVSLTMQHLDLTTSRHEDSSSSLSASCHSLQVNDPQSPSEHLKTLLYPAENAGGQVIFKRTTSGNGDIEDSIELRSTRVLLLPDTIRRSLEYLQRAATQSAPTMPEARDSDEGLAELYGTSDLRTPYPVEYRLCAKVGEIMAIMVEDPSEKSSRALVLRCSVSHNGTLATKVVDRDGRASTKTVSFRVEKLSADVCPLNKALDSSSGAAAAIPACLDHTRTAQSILSPSVTRNALSATC